MLHDGSSYMYLSIGRVFPRRICVASVPIRSRRADMKKDKKNKKPTYMILDFALSPWHPHGMHAGRLLYFDL